MSTPLTYKVGPNPARNRDTSSPERDRPWRIYKTNGMGGRWTVRVCKTKADALAALPSYKGA